MTRHALHLAFVLILAAISSHATAQTITNRIASQLKPQTPEQVIKVFSLRHASSEEMHRIVDELFAPQVSPRTSYGAMNAPRSFRMSSDPRTNALIVRGPKADLEVIETLLAQLDAPTPEGRKAPQVNQAQLLQRHVEQLQRQIVELTAQARRSGFAQSAKRPTLRTKPTESETVPKAKTDAPPKLRAPLPKEKPSAKAPTEAVPGTAIRIQVRQSNLHGPLRIKTIVPSGKKVKKGDVLLIINSNAIEEAVNSQKNAVAQAKAGVQQGEEAVENAVARKSARTKKAELELEMAKIALTEFQNGTRPLQGKILRAELDLVEQRLKQQKGRVSAGQADPVTVKELTNQVEVAATKLKVFEEFTALKLLKQLQAAVAVAENEYELARRTADNEVNAAQSALASMIAQLDYSMSKLQRLTKDLESCRVAAPHDGVVAFVGPQLKEGSFVRNSQIVLSLVTDSKPQSKKR